MSVDRREKLIAELWELLKPNLGMYSYSWHPRTGVVIIYSDLQIGFNLGVFADFILARDDAAYP